MLIGLWGLLLGDLMGLGLILESCSLVGIWFLLVIRGATRVRARLVF